MYQYSKWLILFIIGIAALAIWAIYPLREKINLGLDLTGGLHIELEADPTTLLPGENLKDAVDLGLKRIRNRIDQLGVREPKIYGKGEKGIVVELPDLEEEDLERAKDLIGKTALLEFKLVDEKGDLGKALQGEIPAKDEILYEYENSKEKPYLVKEETLLRGEDVKDARVEFDPWGQPCIGLDFEPGAPTDKFAEVTGQHVGERLAIILDNAIISAPVIKTRISGGKSQITGRFTMDEARDLKTVLKSGKLPISFKTMYADYVGPSLGEDSIRNGLLAGIIGFIAVVLFMIFYYKKAGLIADAALLLNLLFILGALAALKATLTLPGIAGIILIIGMSIDANVIIFERIREELKEGRAPRSAVDAGYNKALRTILDANITTLIVALILLQFGSGPIRGFATTLSIGILASLFTAVVVTRVIFNLLLAGKPIQKLSI